MALTKGQRKDRLGHGGQRVVARKAGEPDWFVSLVVADRAVNYAGPRVRRVQDTLAAQIGLTPQYVFGAALRASEELAEVA